LKPNSLAKVKDEEDVDERLRVVWNLRTLSWSSVAEAGICPSMSRTKLIKEREKYKKAPQTISCL
jgi:hypothetical protein